MIDQMLAMTLQQCLQSLGPMPETHGAFIRRVLAIRDEFHPAKLALGCYLEDCIRSKNYIHLERAINDMKDLKDPTNAD